jgi:DNA-binding XRE family transcriptional regulator
MPLKPIWELPLNKDDRLAVANACRLLRAVYDVQPKKMAREIGFSHWYMTQIERPDKYPASDNVVKKISKYFKLDFPDLIKIGTKCKTPIDTFKYLQRIGKI